jgi:hypothetical protein
LLTGKKIGSDEMAISHVTKLWCWLECGHQKTVISFAVFKASVSLEI